MIDLNQKEIALLLRIIGGTQLQGTPQVMRSVLAEVAVIESKLRAGLVFKNIGKPPSQEVIAGMEKGAESLKDFEKDIESLLGKQGGSQPAKTVLTKKVKRKRK